MKNFGLEYRHADQILLPNRLKYSVFGVFSYFSLFGQNLVICVQLNSLEFAIIQAIIFCLSEFSYLRGYSALFSYSWLKKRN